MVFGKEWRDSCQDSCTESFSHITDTIFFFLVWTTPLLCHQPGLPLAPPSGAYALLRSQLSWSVCRGLERLRGYQWLSCIALACRPFLPIFHEPDWLFPLMEEPLESLTGHSVDPPSGLRRPHLPNFLWLCPAEVKAKSGIGWVVWL